MLQRSNASYLNGVTSPHLMSGVFSPFKNIKMKNDIYKLIRGKNRLLNQWEQYYRKDELQSFPTVIQFPTGTQCNIKCRFCTERQGAKGVHDYRNLSIKDFNSIMAKEGWREAFKGIQKVDLYGWGEPLCNPDYKNIFKYLADNFPGLEICICTNGILFNRKWSEKILSLDRSEVNFSVNAACKETYLELTGNGQFERVISNIRHLTGLREKSGKKSPYVSLSYVATTSNIRELPDFVDLAADLDVDSILVQDVMILNRETEKLSLMNQPDIASKMFKIAEEQARIRKIMISFLSFEIHHEDYIPSHTEKAYFCDDSPQVVSDKSDNAPSPYFVETDCFDPWERLMIRADGEVYPCCRYQDLPGTELGNVHEQSFQDIWNGKAYRFLRKKVNTDNPPLGCELCPRKAGLD